MVENNMWLKLKRLYKRYYRILFWEPITEKVTATAGDNIPAEICYYDRNGNYIGFEAYGYFDPNGSYQGD
jgi:hypothetical protein